MAQAELDETNPDFLLFKKFRMADRNGNAWWIGTVPVFKRPAKLGEVTVEEMRTLNDTTGSGSPIRREPGEFFTLTNSKGQSPLGCGDQVIRKEMREPHGTRSVLWDYDPPVNYALHQLLERVLTLELDVNTPKEVIEGLQEELRRLRWSGAESSEDS